MSESDENALVERVFLRIGSAETDQQLESALGRFLTAVLLKLDSKEEGVRKKVMELLVHVNKRLKSRVKVQLPVDELMEQYRNPESTSIVTNFAMIYIKMGFSRLEPNQQAERVPTLISCIEGRSANHQDSFLQLLMPALEYVQFPQNIQDRRQKFQFITNPSLTKLLLDFMLDLLIVPYGSHTKIAELQQAAARKPSTASTGEPSAPPVAPPGLSISSFKRVMGENPYEPEQLEKVKLGIIKFLGSDIFPENDVVCHYIIGAADTRHSVATAADLELKKIFSCVDFNNSAILTKLFSIFLGTVEVKGQTAVKPDQKRTPACARIRLKLFPQILKARESANAFPYNIQVIFDCLYGQNANVKLKVCAVQLIHHMCLWCTDPKFAALSSVLQAKLINLIKEAKEDAKVMSLSFVAVGKLVHKFPHLVSKNIALVQIFLNIMCQVNAEMRLAVQESLSMMADAFKNLDESNMKIMEALLMQAIDKDEPQARMMSVQYAERIFPADHVVSRYILLLATGDVKDDIRIEALKALNLHQNKNDVSAKPATVLPQFKDMVKYIKEKADVRAATQNCFVIANNKLAFNPVAYGEIILFLRACLAHSAGFKPDMESIVTMKEQAPHLAKFVQSLLQEGRSEMGPIQMYVTLIRPLLKAVGGATVMYCLLEIVAMAPDYLVPQFVEHLSWLKTCVFSMKDDIRDLAANLYSIIICMQPYDVVLEALESFNASLSDKSVEIQHGALLTLGYMIGLILRSRRSQENSQGNSLWQKMEKKVEVAVTFIARLAKVSEENNPMLSAGACQAIGEIGRNVALPLPPGDDGQIEGEITKFSVVKNLLAIIISGKEAQKSKERAALCLGYLCVGEERFCHRKMAITGLMDSVTSKQVELHFSVGEALVYAAQGPTSPAHRNLWTETEEEFKASVGIIEDEVSWYLNTVLTQYVTSVNPHVRQASSIWLLALVKKCSSHPAIQTRLMDLQKSFMQLLSENDELTQDISSKGLGLVYEICSSEQKKMLVSELVDTLTTGKRKLPTVSADTPLFEEGALGKTPEGGNLSTYKELCSIANELNQPDLIYKFMHLANHHAMWNSRKGAAFGFSTIAAQAGEQLTPFLPQIVPRLYRYQFDPNLKIQQAMSSIWNALVQDNKNTVDKYVKEILADLLTNLTHNQWRIRESSCLAVHDLLRGRPLDDVVESLPELWESCLRVLDDIKESVRKAAELACTTLSRASIKICDITYGKVGERAITLVLPCLLKFGLQSPVSEVRAIGLSTMLKISKTAGVLIKPHIPILVTSLLEAISGLEPQVLNYYSLHVSNTQEVQNKLDSARIAYSKMSPVTETINLCVQYTDESVLPELIPRFIELVKSGIGVGTKAACSSFIISLVHQCPKDLNSHAGKLMAAFLNGVADRNMAVRKCYASALGHLVRIAKDSSVESLITRMRTWYLEKEDEAAHNGCGLTLHAISQHSPDVLRRHASLAMPLAFLAMHEKTTDGTNKDNDSFSLWEEVWLEITPGTEAGIRLYLTEIVDLLQETLKSQSWSTKVQAARALSTVADKQGSNLGPPHLANVMTALLEGLQGRTWAGKESLLHAIQQVCKSCRASLQEECGEGFVSKIFEAVLRESKKENLSYKLQALACFGLILEVFNADLFVEVYAIVSPAFEKGEKMEVDGEVKEEIDTEMKQQQLMCYFTVMGQAWPNSTATQDEYMEKVSCVMCETLQCSTWKIQESIMKAMHKYLTRLHTLKDANAFHEKENATKPVLERILLSVSPTLGNLKYTVIRAEALTVVEDIVAKLAELGRLSVLSPEVLDILQSDLRAMSADFSPELQDRSAQLLKIINS